MSEDLSRYTDDMIGEEVEINIDGVRFMDIVVETWLPNMQRLVGPQMICAHIFARYSMIPDKMRTSELVEKMVRFTGDDGE